MVFAPLLHDDDVRRWRACERRFWLHRQRVSAAVQEPAAPDTPDTPDGLRAEATVVYGPAADAALRASYPTAVSIAAPSTPAEWFDAVQQTLACLDTDAAPPEGWAVLGACLTSGDRVQARIDVLACGEHGLRLFKVRYATVGEEADVDTVALWTHVAARCGLQVQSVGLLLVDTDFIYPGHGCYAGLFREVDLGPVLGSRPVASWLAAMRDCAHGPMPAASPGPHCTQHGACEFSQQCDADAQPAPTADPQASLEAVGRELAAELRHEGYADLLAVPLQRLSNSRQRRAVRAVQQGAPVLEPEAAAVLRALLYPQRDPYYCLRFDTIGFAAPIWAGTRPYQVLPFQWSCDASTADGALQRQGFLADAAGDPRRDFALSLLQVLGRAGPVFAYNAGFERNRIRDLAQRFDDLAPALDALQERIVDLFQLARAHYYHPAMCGSWSFKSISRAIAPEVQVAWAGVDLAPTAQAAFARSLQRGVDAATRQQLRSALQAHGQRQTEALRRMLALFAAAV